ncbi:DNA-J related domain-containing protein [Shewanella gelidii]|uniref:Molecular chaperone DnaJ n=1 Tax=Shewanella gelidii TaxID=1642821 RepID=A0A917JKB1_9GAMM|nr:DNA-J related domain-containing protein [Shewanella gelidii]MCL1096839.1 DnaJ domain-containing protein [Shewanella gelidii]GGI70528.1 molecular chaperone DnaJ [Shewanella gelidii]
MLLKPEQPVIENKCAEVTKGDNPLMWPLLSVLQESNKSWKVHHLAAELQNKGLISDLDSNPEKNLFKRNFLLMNALYELQEVLQPKQWLQVRAMDIFICHVTPSNTELLLAQEASLREYYLDWNNYDTSANVVRELLDSFWSNYQSYIGVNPKLMNKQKALRTFELEETASNRDVRRQWRKLALKWHPDRHQGNAEKFREICQAWQTLKGGF